ncbi:MAG: exopolyphosphatase [Saprospiraceae bacterium]
MQKYGVIDLGTNTFHLLIVSFNIDHTFEVIHRERIFVKLAEEGIDTIAAAPFKRGLEALAHFKSILERHQVLEVRAFGTAALRTASNTDQFKSEIKAKTNIDIKVIPGEEEARLIYQGVQQVVSFEKGNSLIMDIGGGSVEFILANQKGVIWSASFPIGVAVLTRKFHKSDPISKSEINQLWKHLDKRLEPLQKVLSLHNVNKLIGASGTFDVLESILSKDDNLSVSTSQPGNTLTSSFPSENFTPLYNKLLRTTLSERLAINNIPDSRAEMIITALMLIQYILELSNASEIIVSSYAMKEGMLQDMRINS